MSYTRLLELSEHHDADDDDDSEITFLINNNKCTELHAPTSKTMNKFTIKNDWVLEKETFSFLDNEVADNMMKMLKNWYIYVPSYESRQIKVIEIGTNELIGTEIYRKRVVVMETCSNMVVIGVENDIYIYQLHKYLHPDHVISRIGPLTSSLLVSIKRDDDGQPLLAYPSDTESGVVQLFQVVGKEKVGKIDTMQTNLTCITLNSGATLLATASEENCNVKVFNRLTGDQLHEFKYNEDEYIRVDSLIFSQTSQFLCCAFQNGTIQICNLHVDDGCFGTIQLPPSCIFCVHGFITNNAGELGLVVSYCSMFVGMYKLDMVDGGLCVEVATYDISRKNLTKTSLTADTNM